VSIRIGTSVVSAEMLGNLDAVHARQTEVEDHDVGQERVCVVERCDSVGGEAHVVALEPQERTRTSAMSSSSSTTRTRGARA